jgi:hypothetical protein
MNLKKLTEQAKSVKPPTEGSGTSKFPSARELSESFARAINKQAIKNAQPKR